MHLDGFGGLSQPEEENEKVTPGPDAEKRICFTYKEWPGIVERVDAHPKPPFYWSAGKSS
jgi:hypothetical protein